jgi:type II secretory ATPase GspE/PulE/Tfp pilus assembly ATPase PilB-like protein
MIGTIMRIMLMVGIIVAVYSLGIGTASAWPPFEPNPTPGTDFRSHEYCLSWIKILAAWFVFMVWVRSADWINIDMEELNLPKLRYQQWNPSVFGTFMFAFVLMWLIPVFWVGFFLVVIAYLTPFITYVVFRNSLVDNNLRVFTPEHLRYWFATRVSSIGIKMESERLDPHSSGPPVTLLGYGGPDNITNNARLLLARQSPGLFVAREIISDALLNRASAVMLDYSQQGAAINIMVDGVWLSRGTKEREITDPALESMKLLCGLNPQDRKNLQTNKFACEFKSAKYIASFTSQGTPTGERAVIQFEDNTIRFKTLDELGMRVKMQGQLKELLESQKGILLFSAMPSGGLRNTMDVALHTCDRFVRELTAVEEENVRYHAIENIPVTTYSAAKQESPATILPKLLRSQPNVVIVRDLMNAETLNLLNETAAEKLIITTTRAKDCADALMQVLALGVPSASLADSVTAVLCQRLVRKLCSDCREPYTPPPNVLQQLGIPPGRIDALYRPRQPNPEEKIPPCETCNAIGYLGRTAIFELLVIGDAVRQTLKSKPTAETLRKAARKDGMKTLQEEGILLVAKGVTSLPELLRALKQ